MKKKYILLILLSALSLSEGKTQKIIQFIPEEFNDIKLGYHENEMSICSPGYPDDRVKINTLAINIPHTILHKKKENTTPVIPICITSGVSRRRFFKYHELSAKMIYVRKEDEDIVYSGKIVEPNESGRSNYYPNGLEAVIKEKEKNIAEAQKYRDKDLNEGQYSEEHWNLNLLDYVDMAFLPGKYEVWVAFSGLESNHMFVEIIME